MTQWYEHTGLSFLLLIHDFDHGLLSTILLSNLSSLSYAKRFTNKLGNRTHMPVVHESISLKASLQFLVRARPRCTQAGSPGQIKADSQCWCIVVLFLFPSFSEAALASETANACFNILPRPRHGFVSKLSTSLSSLLNKMG